LTRTGASRARRSEDVIRGKENTWGEEEGGLESMGNLIRRGERI